MQRGRTPKLASAKVPVCLAASRVATVSGVMATSYKIRRSLGSTEEKGEVEEPKEKQASRIG